MTKSTSPQKLLLVIRFKLDLFSCRCCCCCRFVVHAFDFKKRVVVTFGPHLYSVHSPFSSLACSFFGFVPVLVVVIVGNVVCFALTLRDLNTSHYTPCWVCGIVFVCVCTCVYTNIDPFWCCCFMLIVVVPFAPVPDQIIVNKMSW